MPDQSALSSGSFVVTTQGGTLFDSIVGVYTGETLTSHQLVGENDNFICNFTTSRVVFDATAGTTYRIVVGGKNGSSGLFRLTLGQPPANDNFTNAFTLSGTTLPITATGHGRTATLKDGEPVIVSAGFSGGTPSGGSGPRPKARTTSSTPTEATSTPCSPFIATPRWTS